MKAATRKNAGYAWPPSEAVSKAAEPYTLLEGLNPFDGRFLPVGDIDADGVREIVLGYETYMPAAGVLTRPVIALFGGDWQEDESGQAALRRILDVMYGKGGKHEL